ncbi:MAG TPA: two-component regulator propeller domain-containing protein [Agriterribacter sp.]|nr:two-component regulator propeller domain-containing protein [Agriterribacter sp.]
MKKLYFLAYILFFYLNGFTQEDAYHFMRLDVRQGLSHNQVNCILKDSKGFMWFGSMSGLNRYDGYDFKVFKNELHNPASLSDNYVERIFELPDRKMWVATRNGNNIYDPLTESFNRKDQEYLSQLSLPPGSVYNVVKDKQGNYWFIYQNNAGVYRYSPSTKKIVALQHNPEDSATIATNDVAVLAQDSNGNIWIVHRNGIVEKLKAGTYEVIQRTDQLKSITQNSIQNYTLYIDSGDELWISVLLSGNPGGIFYYQPARDRLSHFTKDAGDIRLNTNIITGITQDQDGKIWIGTDHGGINLVDKKEKSVRYLLSDAEDHTTISQNSIYSVYKDSSNMIWLGTYKQGICYYNNNMAMFSLYRHKVSDPNSLPYEDINKFAEDAKGNLWIGTNGGGLMYFDRLQNKFSNFQHNPSNPNSLSNDVIVSLLVDHEKKLWIGTYMGGLDCYDGKKFRHFRHNPSDTNTISDNSIWQLFEDKDNNLWVGTLSGGLNRYDRDKDIFYHYRVEDGRSLHSNYISAIIEDKENNIWLGTSNGIDVFNKTNGIFRYLGHDDNDSSSLSNNNVISALQDSRGLIWVGTREGLNLLDKAGNTFTVFRKEDGLADNTILTILEDDKHNLWLGTPNGLSNVIVNGNGIRVNIQVKNYDESNGLQGREFNDKAAFKTKGGELLFGGPYGFNLFNPDKFLLTKPAPEIALTEFFLFNKPVKVGEKLNGHVVLNKAFTETENITLQYNENVFSIAFAALGSAQSLKDKFIYTLEGFNKEWLSTDGRQRTITYTNLDPGTYVFRVKSDGDYTGGNKEGVVLHITILPPFWKTAPAFLLYMLLAGGILLFARRLTIQRAKTRFQFDHQKKEAQRIHELDMLKLKFFTNVSHEFRTPLSLIITPVEKMMKQTEDEGQKKQFQLIHRNAKRLLGLVNQLLDFRKLELHELRLYPSLGDMVSFVKELTFSFTDLAEKKNISFTFSSDVESLDMFFDPDKIERIMFNLLSNAFKFTSECGSIKVHIGIKEISAGEAFADITVSDSGIGIPLEKQDKIFERFFQHEVPDNILNQGSGIGLAISREFARLHGGHISVASKPGEGSSFTVSLPLKSQSLIPVQDSIAEREIIMHAAHQSEDDNIPDKAVHRKESILIVDDNDDIRFYIKDNLRVNYIVYEAMDGKEGWKKAQEFQPDLVISDIMMPEMNGMELCCKIKNDVRTSHIPVILLTAKSAEEQKLAGFETGANDYITKPFSFEMLFSRIKGLLAHQEALRRLFQNQIEIEPKAISITPVDEQFIAKAVDEVEKNISESDFSVEDLSKALFMSRVALYKKLLSLTGKAPLDFIRSIRMKRAAQLLSKTQMTVSEVAYEVGFSNPKYFTKFFKKEFNLLPSEYISINRGNQQKKN